jgi:hypothetical protein
MVARIMVRSTCAIDKPMDSVTVALAVAGVSAEGAVIGWAEKGRGEPV